MAQPNPVNSRFRRLVFDALIKISREAKELAASIETYSDLELLMYLEKAWSTFSQVKSFANFLEEDLGLNQDTCVVIIVDTHILTLQMLDIHLRDIKGRNYLTTTAETFAEGKALVEYYARRGNLCVLITDVFLDQPFDPDISGIGLMKVAKRIADIYHEKITCIALCSQIDLETHINRDKIKQALNVLADVVILREEAPKKLSGAVREALRQSKSGE